MPIIRAWLSRSGPPELPGLIAASIWMIDFSERPERRLGSERFRLEMMPVVSVRSSPKGLPMANTRWPTRKLRRIAEDGRERAMPAGRRSSAPPRRWPGPGRPAGRRRCCRRTRSPGSARAPSTTWKLVRMCPWRSMTTPLPSPFGRHLDQQEPLALEALGGDVHHAAVDLLIDPDIDPLLGRVFGRFHGIWGAATAAAGGTTRGSDGGTGRASQVRRQGQHRPAQVPGQPNSVPCSGRATGPRPAIHPGFRKSDSIRQFVSQRCSTRH